MKDIFKKMGVDRLDFDSKGKVSYVGGRFTAKDMKTKVTKEDLKKNYKVR